MRKNAGFRTFLYLTNQGRPKEISLAQWRSQIRWSSGSFSKTCFQSYDVVPQLFFIYHSWW